MSLARQLSRSDGPVTDAAFISIDRAGADVRLRRGGQICVERLGFREVLSLAGCCNLICIDAHM